MVVGIVGSRGYPDLSQVEDFVYALAVKYPNALVVSGGARDVDITAEEAAFSRMLRVRSYRPKKHGRSYVILVIETGRHPVTVRNAKDNRPMTFPSFKDAAFYRNGLIASDSNQLVAFHYQGSYGTQDTINKARARGIPTYVYSPRV